jgi:hypothetical protein
MNKPVDGWRISADDSYWMCYLKDGKYVFGINSVGDWITWGEFEPDEDRLATDDEVKQRLTRLVNGMGYKEGVTVKNLVFSDEFLIKSNDLKFDISDVGFYFIQLGGFSIWHSDKGWAKIVEKPKFEVEKGCKNHIQESWSKENGAEFYFTIKNKSMIHSDYICFSTTDLAKKIETILNSEK